MNITYRSHHSMASQNRESDFGSAEVFPADINMDVLGGVALNKGCFVGQEVVSRMHRRGTIRRSARSVVSVADGPNDRKFRIGS